MLNNNLLKLRSSKNIMVIHYHFSAWVSNCGNLLIYYTHFWTNNVGLSCTIIYFSFLKLQTYLWISTFVILVKMNMFFGIKCYKSGYTARVWRVSRVGSVNLGALSRIIVGPCLALNNGVLPPQTGNYIQSNQRQKKFQ